MERELKKRRDWIQNFRRDFPGKFPDDVSKYYEKDNVKEDKKEGEEEDDDIAERGNLAQPSWGAVWRQGPRVCSHP